MGERAACRETAESATLLILQKISARADGPMKTSSKNDRIGRCSIWHGQVKLFWDIYREREEIHPPVLFTDVAKKLHKHDCTLQKVPN